MKEKIHPEYKEATITCACGEVIHTRSTKQNIKIEICSKCHPYFTGKQKLIDSAGRVEKYKKRFLKKAPPKVKKSKGKAPEAAPEAPKAAPEAAQEPKKEEQQ